MSQASVIIPTYYRNDRLRSALDSVREQTHEPIEIVVVDDSGEGYAQEVIASTEDDITYVAHDTNEGAHAARDTGLQHCSGEYIQFLDDDDQLHATKVEKQVELLSQRKHTDVVYCGIEHEDGPQVLPDPAVSGDVLEHVLGFYDHPLMTSAMLIHTDVLNDVRPLCRDSSGADDIRMAIELAQRTQFDFVDEVLVTAGRPENSRGVSWGSVEGRWSILREYSGLYEDMPDRVRGEAIAETYQLQGRRYLDDRMWSLAAVCSFGQALRHTPVISPLHVGEFISSLGGRPGRNIARSIVR